MTWRARAGQRAEDDRPRQVQEPLDGMSPVQRWVLNNQRTTGTWSTVTLPTAFAVTVSVIATAIVSGVIVGDRGASLWVGLAQAVGVPAVLTP